MDGRGRDVPDVRTNRKGIKHSMLNQHQELGE